MFHTSVFHGKLLTAGLMASGLAIGAAHAQVTNSFTVSGSVGTPTTFTSASLATLTPVTQTDTFNAAGKPTTDTFTGPTLYSVLQAAGGITVDPTVKNDLLTKYVVTTGSDGYVSVISAGEIAPKFGNKADLVATSDTSNTLPSPNGFARITTPGDVAGGRYVSNLASVVVGSAPLQPGTIAGPTTSLTLQGAVAAAMTITAATLQAMTPVTETVTYLSGTTSVTDTYTGVLLWNVLNSAGILTNPSNKNDILRKLVTVTGSDGYNVDLSLGEIDLAFGNEPVLLAYSDTDGQISGGAGFARLVVPGDMAGGRYVSNISSLTVFDPTITAVPEPASLVLLLGGVVAFGLLRRRA